MEKDLYEIIYASAATRPIEEELFVMLKFAGEKNTRNEITGMSLLQERSIIPVLEGPKDLVMDASCHSAGSRT